MRARRRFLGGIAAAAFALVALPAGALGAVTADPVTTILYVKGDADSNQIQVDCRSGIVTVNGAPAAEGRASCADLEKLGVYGFGGDDTIALTGFRGLFPEGDEGFFDEYGEERVEITVDGGDGNDSVTGDAIGEVLNGGAGNDVLRGGNGLGTIMLGGPGNDDLFASTFAILLGGRGADRLLGGTGFSYSFGQAGPDVFSGSGRPDLAGGGKGRDKLAGNGGSDILVGEAGRDVIFGGAGRDLLAGSAGRDRLRGGPGRDREFQGGLPDRRMREFFEYFASAVLGSGDEVVVATRIARQFLR